MIDAAVTLLKSCNLTDRTLRSISRASSTAGRWSWAEIAAADRILAEKKA